MSPRAFGVCAVAGLVGCAIVIGGAFAASAQEERTYRQVEVRGSDGALRGRHTARERKPDDLLSTPRVHLSFLRRHDVADEQGRIVSGIGVSAWIEGTGARVWLVSLVPKKGVGNAFYATRQGMANLSRNPLAEFTLQMGERRTVTQMEAWGVEPLVLELVEYLPGRR